MHGFKLIEKRFVKEVNAECYYFEHEKSGAKLLKIANDDQNKTFAIAFKTPPATDNGIAHIMEHSVLNGSKNFPVKSPFDILIKGSLNTFLNAFTSKDRTMYPVASMNDKDFFNLMHVYLDAVFNPILYYDDRVLKQEGWHFELTGINDPLIYKGVVYNEMKGAYSNPVRELRYRTFKALFPETTYGFESGGYPEAIPSLTQEEFINFHKKCYHPENSYIFLYGNGDTEKELAFINDNYLDHYTRINNPVVIDIQKPLASLEKLNASYPVLEGADTTSQTFLSMAFVAGTSDDRMLTMALDILAEVLVNQESAPIRLALQKEKIGQDVYISAENYKQNVMNLVVKNAHKGQRDKLFKVVMDVLSEQVKNGLDKETVNGIVNRMEFQLREGDDAQKGLAYISQSVSMWMHTGDPFEGMMWEKTLKNLKREIEKGYLEKLISQYLINNTHGVILELNPMPGLETKNIQRLTEKLASIKAHMSKEDLTKMVEETKMLQEYQKHEDTPEALATIPMLSIKDIDPKATFFEAKESKFNGATLLHFDEFTNDIVYANWYFDMRVLPLRLIPYAQLLTDVFTSLDTKNYSYADLNKAINLHTGGLYFYTQIMLENQNDSLLIPKFIMSSKAMNDKTDKIFELGNEILLNTAFADTTRLHTVLTRVQSQYEASVNSDGFKYAATRAYSYFTRQGLLKEMTSGIEYYWFVTDLLKNFNSKSEEIVTNLNETIRLLINRQNLVAGLTCSKKIHKNALNIEEQYILQLPDNAPVVQTWDLKPAIKNEGILTPSKVQYVIQGYDFKKLGYAYSGKMQVLRQILSTEYLQNRIRVLGGAYGGFSTIQASGLLTFNSYRDPNLGLTLENYAKTTDFLKNYTTDSSSFTRFIIGTISTLDNPYTPSEKGNIAFSAWMRKEKAEDLQSERNGVLSATVADINSFAAMIEDVLDQKAWCVYGNVEMIKSEKNRFKTLLPLKK